MSTDLTTQESQQMLTENTYGHLGCSVDNKPYVVPITYVYTGGAVLSATSAGKKIDMLRQNPSVCLQVEHVGEDGTWQSVICYGTYQEITKEDEIQSAKKTLAEEYGSRLIQKKNAIISPMVEGLHEKEHKHTVVFRIKIDEITGKKGATY